MDDNLERLSAVIREYTANSPLNRMEPFGGVPYFETPLIGVADGRDPLFAYYRALIGPFHITPQELLQAEYPGTLPPETQRVVCWALPISAETRLSNRRERTAPSERWAYTRAHGERFNDALREYVQDWLRAQDVLAAAPLLSTLYRERLAGLNLTSPWSERHALYAAGLGTFSLSDGFITPAGVAMRCGSVVTTMPLPVTARRHSSHVANCLALNGGSCDACIRRCPAGAISVNGHDKARCLEYQEHALKPLRERLGLPIIGCGLCQTGVPCEAGIPLNRAAAPASR